MSRALLAVVFLVAACKDERPLATLLDLDGVVESAHGDAVFAAAKKGEAFAIGDAVRTGVGATARVRLRDASVVRVKPESVLRFGRGGKKSGVKLDVDFGEAEVETEAGLELDTSLGVAVLEPGTRVRLRSAKAGGGISYEVLLGAASIDGGGGGRLDLKMGDAVIDEAGKPRRYRVEIANAVIDPRRPRPDAGVVAARPDAAPASTGVVATVAGSGSKIKGPGESGWRELATGDVAVAARDELRVGTGSIDIRRGAEHVILETGSEARVGDAGDPLVAVSRGTARFEEVAVAVPGGVIHARGVALAAVKVDGKAATVSVARGEVEVESGGASETIRVGERGVVGTTGGVKVAERAPATFDLTVAAGETATIHDVSQSRPVRVAFGDLCPAQGLLEIPGKTRWVTVGAGSGNLLLGASAVRYQIRCLEGGVEGPARGAGTLSAVNDSGGAKIVKSAPKNTLDADGRRYTVLYQNRLPMLTLRWPGAATSGAFELHVKPAGGEERVVPLATATHSLELREGEYTWWYTLPAERRRSPTTTVKIGFDNAAPTVQITSPDAGASFAGKATTVSGVVLEGSRVTVDGRSAPLDPQNRFSVELTAPAAIVVIRIEHPRLGVHYYVRRSK